MIPWGVVPILSFDALLANVPELSEHTVAPPALRPLAGASELEAALSQICRLPAAPPRAFAALGNLLLRRGAYVDALEAYRTAAALDPDDAPLHWMCAEIAHVLGDVETSLEQRSLALALQRVYPDPLPAGDRIAVLLLLRDLPYSANAPLELILDRSRVAVHKYYLEGETGETLPPFDVAFTAFTAARNASAAMRRAAACAAGSRPINDPQRLPRIARETLAQTLSGVAGAAASRYEVVPAHDLRASAVPALMRPADTHAGEGFVYAVDASDVSRLVQTRPAGEYFRAPFVEYRSADGWYRKFRAVFVDGRVYPYHLAVSPQWMVHYQTAPMETADALREEEARFLRDPQTFVPQWQLRMEAIAEAIGLDYFGIDATVLPDGSVFVFEADAAMLVHDEDARGVFAYKRPYVARIREALHELIARRTRGETPSAGHTLDVKP